MIGYGTIYRFEFDGTCNPFGTLLTTKGKVLILKKGYSGAITDIPYGQVSPVEIDYPTADDDIFYPIRGSILSFKVIGGAINMDSIISEDETEYVLEYYRDNELFWTGFVSPELCEEDIFLKYPAIEFKTIDGLSAFKNSMLKEANGRTLYGLTSFKDILASALKFIGYNYNINILLKLKIKNQPSYITRLIDYIGSYMNIYRDKGNVKFGTDVVIKSICYLFNTIIYQNRGQWFFIKPKDLTFNLLTTDKYNADGAYIGTGNIKQFYHGTDFLIISQPKRKIRRFYKQAQINYQYYNGDAVLNSNFNIFTKDTVFTVEKKYQTDGNAINATLTILDNPVNPQGPGFLGFNYNNVFPCYNNATLEWNLALIDSSSYISKSTYVAVDETFSYTINVLTYARLEIKLTEPTQTTKYWYNNQWNNTSLDTIWRTNVNSEINIPVPYSGLVEVKIMYSDYFDIYNQIVVYFNLESTYGSNTVLPNSLESTTVVNPKNTSISPSILTVYNGTYILKDNLIDKIEDESNILSSFFEISENIYYEREEEYGYKIQELAIRNTLNQYSDYRNIFTGTIIGEKLEYGAIYNFPVQGALAEKKFFPLSMKFNERDCTADVVFMELTSNEIDPSVNCTLFDSENNIVYQELTSSKKKSVME
jgi:hypothetical protein